MSGGPDFSSSLRPAEFLVAWFFSGFTVLLIFESKICQKGKTVDVGVQAILRLRRDKSGIEPFLVFTSSVSMLLLSPTVTVQGPGELSPLGWSSVAGLEPYGWLVNNSFKITIIVANN